jgi:hypothetical protein
MCGEALLVGKAIALTDRFCSNCGEQLEPQDSSCAGCGRPVHEAARVTTPRANGRVPLAHAPDRPRRERRHGEARDATRGPMWGMLAAFLALVAGETAQRMPPAASGGTLAFRLGAGVAFPLALALLLGALVLLLGGVYYAAARKDGVAFREAVFNWSMVSTTWGVAVVFLIR